MTRDKDLGQLVLGEDDEWWDFAADQRLDAAGLTERFGVSPTQLADYLALVGDSVDDIPGVPGVGPKTAAGLLQAFGDLETLGGSLEQVAALPLRGAARVQQRLQEYWPQVQVARRLTGLESAIPELTELPAFTLKAEGLLAAADHLESLGLEGPLVRRYQQRAQELGA